MGTVVEEYRENREGFEISGDASGTYSEYEGGIAFRRFESGSCDGPASPFGSVRTKPFR